LVEEITGIQLLVPRVATDFWGQKVRGRLDVLASEPSGFKPWLACDQSLPLDWLRLRLDWDETNFHSLLEGSGDSLEHC
jgi:hypothetical protein